ncbi:hypothetical protein FQR65_LT15365 [Abscondita terminalis]|nr:hypothetical protein FQR65_LT15365 [Abscondita terminalis]
MEMIILEMEEKMESSISGFKDYLSKVRTGRANASMLKGVVVDFYGSPTPIEQTSAITSPEPQQLVIKPYDRSQIANIVAGINKANLGLNPLSEADLIRINIPSLTEEIRKDLVKKMLQELETFKIRIRNLRRDANDAIKKDTLKKVIGQAEVIFLLLENNDNKERISVPYNFVEVIELDKSGRRKNPYDLNDVTTGEFFQLDQVMNTTEMLNNYNKKTIMPRRSKDESTRSIYDLNNTDTKVELDDYIPIQNNSFKRNIVTEASEQYENLRDSEVTLSNLEDRKVMESKFLEHTLKQSLNSQNSNQKVVNEKENDTLSKSLYEELDINEVTAEMTVTDIKNFGKSKKDSETIEIGSIDETFGYKLSNDIDQTTTKEKNIIENRMNILYSESYVDENTQKLVNSIEKQKEFATETLENDNEYIDMKNNQDPIFKNLVSEETTDYITNNFLADLSFNIENGAIGFMTMLLLVVSVSVLTIATLGFLVYYLVSNMNFIQKRVVYNEYKLKQNIEIINEVQQYNSESSVLMLKLHRDTKKLKNNLEELKNDLEKIKKSLKIETPVIIEKSNGENNGDFSTNLAMLSAKSLKDNPQNIAKLIVDKISIKNIFDKIEIAGPGFINFTFKNSYVSKVINEILKQKENYGKGKKKNFKYDLEIVSANPTGFLHVGHARNGAIGSTVANLLKFSGYEVITDYYTNDQGNQINILAVTLFYYYLLNNNVKVEAPEEMYGGEIYSEISKEFVKKFKDKFVKIKFANNKIEDPEVHNIFREEGVVLFLELIKKQMNDFGVYIDHFSSEKLMYENKEIEKLLNLYESLKVTYESEGALFLRTTDFGDDKDRVLIKKDGDYTYITPDLASHNVRIQRSKADKYVNF